MMKLKKNILLTSSLIIILTVSTLCLVTWKKTMAMTLGDSTIIKVMAGIQTPVSVIFGEDETQEERIKSYGVDLGEVYPGVKGTGINDIFPIDIKAPTLINGEELSFTLSADPKFSPFPVDKSINAAGYPVVSTLVLYLKHEKKSTQEIPVVVSLKYTSPDDDSDVPLDDAYTITSKIQLDKGGDPAPGRLGKRTLKFQAGLCMQKTKQAIRDKCLRTNNEIPDKNLISGAYVGTVRIEVGYII